MAEADEFRYPGSAYARKFRRAEQHLEAIEDELLRYQNSSPYIPIRDRETDPNPRVWLYRAELAKEVSPDLPLVIGDCIHNLRASLDHLQAALVPPNRHRQAKFPVEREDIWQTDEQTNRYLDRFEDKRTSWISTMKGIDPDAEAYIKRLQPYSHPYPVEIHILANLHALDNADKHFELLLTATGIERPSVTLANAEFRIQHQSEDTVESGGVIANFNIRPRDVKAYADSPVARELILSTMSDGTANMDVELAGVPKVALKPAGMVGKQIPLPEGLQMNLDEVRNIVLRPLEEFVLPHGRATY